MKPSPSVADVRQMTKPASSFLCEIGGNKYALQFLEHSIWSEDEKERYFTFQ